MNILWIEDYPCYIEKELEILENAGHFVETCEFVSEAYQILQKEHCFNFVIIDIVLPEYENQFQKDLKRSKRKIGLNAESPLNGLALAFFLTKNQPSLDLAFYSFCDSLEGQYPEIQDIPIFYRGDETYRKDGILKVIEKNNK